MYKKDIVLLQISPQFRQVECEVPAILHAVSKPSLQSSRALKFEVGRLPCFYASGGPAGGGGRSYSHFCNSTTGVRLFCDEIWPRFANLTPTQDDLLKMPKHLLSFWAFSQIFPFHNLQAFLQGAPKRARTRTRSFYCTWQQSAKSGWPGTDALLGPRWDWLVKAVKMSDKNGIFLWPMPRVLPRFIPKQPFGNPFHD